ncbi:MAG: hypothetical protein GY778_03470 [bacterium]|nr:hypothetical protein [bacterium]
MDPNFIHMDWERTFDAIMMVAVVAIIIERALSVIFQSSIYIEYVHKSGMKETIALAVSIAVCAAWKLDAMGMIILTATTTVPGYIVTGALVAGGSKGSVKLFQDMLNLQSSAFRMRHTIQAAKAAEDAEKAEAQAEAAPTKRGAEIAKAKADAAVKRVKVAAARAEADDKVVPSEVIDAAESARKGASEAVDTKTR